jgi:trehalose 6-phosphate phosphatase
MSPAPADMMSEIETRAPASGTISLFLDFDGTLVPISGDPDAPRLSAAASHALELLSGRQGIVTTIISGRAIEDLYGRIRLDGLIYAGNHGLEIFGRQFRFIEPAACQRREDLERLCDDLESALRWVAGVMVERKGLTAAVHFRHAAESGWTGIEECVRAAVAQRGDLFRVTRGRKVFDILPRTGWDKGAAAKWINRHLGGELLTIYLGDDATDEDAFRVLPHAVTIKVGPVMATCARYRLPGPPEVENFLIWLANISRN